MHITLKSFVAHVLQVNELRQAEGTIKRAGDAVEMGAAMAEFAIDNWEEILGQVEPGDLYIDLEEPKRFGAEEYPHVSLLVGLHDGEFAPGVLTDYLAQQPQFDVELTGVSIFENRDYDVVKFDVRSDDLTRMNAYLKEHFPYTTNFPDYVPHMTIAYVKPGCGAKYVRDIPDPVVIAAKKFVYSDSNRKLYKVSPYDPKKV